MTPFQQHVQNWKGCQLCPLHLERRRVVLARGKVPCDVLFIGEAPGDSEDILGHPFVGPAGKLLDDMINDAMEMRGISGLRLGFTNLLACIPVKDAKGRREPKKASIVACSPRLQEFMELARPRLIIKVGAIAQENLRDLHGVGIIHPSAILQMDAARKPVTIQMAIVALADAMEDLV